MMGVLDSWRVETTWPYHAEPVRRISRVRTTNAPPRKPNPLTLMIIPKTVIIQLKRFLYQYLHQC
jgi:hypothetical protein